MSTETTAPHTAISVNNAHMLRAMVGIGIVCAFLIVSTFEITLPTIEKNKAEALEKAVFKVLPGMTEKRTFEMTEEGSLMRAHENEVAGEAVYAGYGEDGQLVGLAVEASGQGFADVLRILYGYDPYNQAIIGYHVLESKETPGLGDKIEKDEAFLANFMSLDVTLKEDLSALQNEVKPVKKGKKTKPWEVDGITGATISSRAIGNIISESTKTWVPLLYAQLSEFESNDTE